LLEPGMQNRQIIDAAFAQVGKTPELVAETSELASAMLTAATGFGAAILPEVLVQDLGVPEGTVALPIVEPALETAIVLLARKRSPAPPAVEALRSSARRLHDKL
ncbi:MAG: LysR family transcriptional regulator substrate-binding protein, partial [Pseudomonadota bacterium]